MQRPIEKYGWLKDFQDSAHEGWEKYYKYKKNSSNSCPKHIITFSEDGDIMDCNFDGYISADELQAIYKTAQQIQKENE